MSFSLSIPDEKISTDEGERYMKLIAIDLDGTLLSSKIDISKENIEAVKLAQKQGHIVMICSGRAPEDIHKLLETIDIQCPIAGSNGTAVFIEDKKLSTVSISQEDAKKVKEILDQYEIPFKVYTNSGIFIHSSWKQRVESLLQRAKSIPDELVFHLDKMREEPVDSDIQKRFEDFKGIENHKIQKFFVLTLLPEMKEQISEKMQAISGITVTSSGAGNLEIMDINGNKGNGIKVMAEHYNIPMEQTVAIGDNLNDIPMLQTAGLSIAMGNADPAVKELCDVVTLTNDEHGVAHAIKKFVLRE